MVKTAFLFPGQGAQFVGMGKEFHDAFPWAREMYEEASDVLGLDLANLCFNGPEDELTLTRNTQPALLVHSTIALKSLGDHGINPVLAAGHSLGEFSALVCSGSLRFADAVRLVQQRGTFMQEAVPVGVGTMGAIIGLSLDKIQEICDRISTSDNLVQPANLNSPEQVVISGHQQAVVQATEEAKTAGAKKTVLLPVSAPFHCSLMKPAEIKLQKELEKTDFEDNAFPVITNTDAKLVTKGAEAREALVRQVCSPVRWTETMEVIVSQGVEQVIEFGAGRVLSGLMRRFNKATQCLQVGDPESLEKTLSALG